MPFQQYDPKGVAVDLYARRLPELLAVEDKALEFGDVSASYWAGQYRKVVRRAMEAELEDPQPQPAPIAHCLACVTYRNRSGGGVL